MNSSIFVVMGVSGCGKSTVGARLAAALGFPFLEGDSLHSARNVASMAAGFPLSDEDREGWLRTLAEHIADARAAGRGLVVSCSALKRAYRDILREGASDLHFVHLHGDHALLEARMAARTGHYMPLSLLGSQLATLETPGADEDAQQYDMAMETDAIVTRVMAHWPATRLLLKQ
ncbi:MAG TPA: gluconokinase [Polaromonas sp.]|uniref:gluconokinase n=1 Tax=Polaromonas sp. TaxID=1869339 RepID=UPI002D7184ED|nr:gluconokinase [Polaromonas sp.]HYW56652.1 gluconokinase [Polaromonas sp.]